MFLFGFSITVRAQGVPNVSDLGSFFKDVGSISNVPGSVDDTLTATVAPENPEPNSPVSIDLADYSTDINHATISWFLNGKKILEGVGKKSFLFTNGDLGQTTKVKVNIITEEGNTLENNFSFTPSSISIIAEVRGYTPPFYKGRVLFASQGTLHLVALPNFTDSNGNRLDPTKLTYKWKRNNRILNDVSGYGKNVVDITEGVPLGSTEISVEATSFDNTLTASTILILSSQDPKIIFYEKDPFYGFLFNRALKSPFLLTNNEVSVTAFPFFFSTSRASPLLNYEWSMNREVVNSGTNDSMTFKNTSGEAGSSQVSVSVRNTARIFQMADTDLTINFGNIQNSSLTGL
ncbi:MAG: hypothetical protein WCO30_02255 [bacterium]